MNTRPLSSILISLLVFAGSLANAQNQTQTQLADRLTDLGNRDSFFDILKLYQDSAAHLEPMWRIYAQMCIANAFNRPDEYILYSDSLTAFYPPNDFPSAYKCIKAKNLLVLGKYYELADYCLKPEENVSEEANPEFTWYKYLAGKLKDTPDSSLDFAQGECSIATTKNFPIRLSLQINGTKVPDVIFDTGAPFTFLSYATAQKCKVRLLGDTLTVGSYYGNVSSTTGLIEELRVGDMILRHVNVKVALPGAPVYFQENDALGLQDLLQLSSIEYSPGKLTFRKTDTPRKALRPNMCLRNGVPYLRNANDAQNKEFMLDTGCDINVLYDTVAIGSLQKHLILADSIPFEIQPRAEVTSHHCSGVLGFPYTSDFDSCTFDLEEMSFTGKGFRQSLPPYSIRINNGDFAMLDANLKWYANRLGEMDNWILRTYLGITKNHPEECIAYTDSLLTKYEKELGPSILPIISARAAAFAYLGDFSAAIPLFNVCLPSMPDLRESTNKATALESVGKESFDWSTPTTSIPAKADNNGWSIAVQINRMPSTVYVNLAKEESEISPQEASNYHMKIVEYKADSLHTKKIAIADEVTLGGVTARNLRFRVNENVQGISLGNNTLRQIPQFSISKKRITLYQEPVSIKNTAKYPLLLINYKWCYYLHQEAGLKKYSIGTPYPDCQPITINELLEQNKQVIFDTRNMNIEMMR